MPGLTIIIDDNSKLCKLAEKYCQLKSDNWTIEEVIKVMAIIELEKILKDKQ